MKNSSFIELLSAKSNDAKNSCIGIIGGGGKTSLMFHLGKEMSQIYKRVILTAITKAANSSEFKCILFDSMQNLDLVSEFEKNNPLYVMHPRDIPEKLAGISVTDLQYLNRKSDICIFECDGARNLPLKVHNEHDPQVPDFATHIIIIIGADVVNTRIIDGKVHRPELFKQMWNINDDFVLSEKFIAEVVSSPKGYLTKVCGNTPLTYFINKAEAFPNNAKNLAKAVSERTSCPTFFGSIHQNQIEKIN